MIPYLSDAWLAEADEAVRRHDGLRTATLEMALVVQQLVTGAPDGDRAYAVQLDHGDNSVVRGRAPEPDVVFECAFPTAVAIATGRDTAPAAFIAGRLTLAGDARALVHHAVTLDVLDDVLDDLRARTAFPD